MSPPGGDTNSSWRGGLALSGGLGSCEEVGAGKAPERDCYEFLKDSSEFTGIHKQSTELLRMHGNDQGFTKDLLGNKDFLRITAKFFNY